jgi:N6-L-threonylcarbamoyladenine synthase
LECPETIQHPALSLVVSGGHTSLFLMKEESSYELIGKTRDDAAGEAYDKVAKLLGLEYPGGPILDRLARAGSPKSIDFPVAKISDGSEDFSFSGLKSAVLRTVKSRGIEPVVRGEDPFDRPEIVDLAASFQKAVVRSLISRSESAARRHQVRSILVSGGVAANSLVRAVFAELGEKLAVPVWFPSVTLSTDNAAMVAAAGYLKYVRKEFAGLDLNVDVELRLGEGPGRRSRRHL